MSDLTCDFIDVSASVFPTAIQRWAKRLHERENVPFESVVYRATSDGHYVVRIMERTLELLAAIRDFPRGYRLYNVHTFHDGVSFQFSSRKWHSVVQR